MTDLEEAIPMVEALSLLQPQPYMFLLTSLTSDLCSPSSISYFQSYFIS